MRLTPHATAALHDPPPPQRPRRRLQAWMTLALRASASASVSALCSNFTLFLCVSGRPVTIDGSEPGRQRSVPIAANVSARPSRRLFPLLRSSLLPVFSPSLLSQAHKDARTYCTFSQDHTPARADIARRGGHFQSAPGVCLWKRGRPIAARRARKYSLPRRKTPGFRRIRTQIKSGWQKRVSVTSAG